MSNKYVIKWKSKVNGRAGKGTKEFDRDEGEQLVAELNAEYPDIEHELLRVEQEPEPVPAEPLENSEQSIGSPRQGQPETESAQKLTAARPHALSLK